MNAFKYPAPVALAMSTLAHAGDPCAATVVTGGTYAFSTCLLYTSDAADD